MLRIANALFLITIGTNLVAEDTHPLPQGDQDSIDRAVSSHSAIPVKAYEAYQKALAEATAKIIKDLDKLKISAMKNGNLPLANAVDAKEKEVKGGALNGIVLSQEKQKDNVDLLGNQIDPKTIIIGKWKRSDGFTSVFKADGTGMVGSEIYKWKIGDNGIIKVTFPLHTDWYLDITVVDDKSVTLVRNDGVQQTMEKIVGTTKDFHSLLVGQWKISVSDGWTGTETFSADNTCQVGDTHGKYNIDMDIGTIIVNWDNGKTDTIDDIKENNMSGKSSAGTQLTYTKIGN